MLADAGQRHPERCAEFADARRPATESLDHRPRDRRGRHRPARRRSVRLFTIRFSIDAPAARSSQFEHSPSGALFAVRRSSSAIACSVSSSSQPPPRLIVTLCPRCRHDAWVDAHCPSCCVPAHVSPLCAARRRGCLRWRGGMTRARRPRPGRAPAAARGAARRRPSRRLHGEADAVFGDHDIADRVGLGEEDAEVGGVHPAAAVAAGGRVFGDLVAQVLPAAQGGRERGAGAARALPVVLGALGARQHRLVAPGEVHGAPEGTTSSPLDVGAERARGGVDEHHSAGAIIERRLVCAAHFSLHS